MGWSHKRYFIRDYSLGSSDTFEPNEECFIRKGHTCEKIFGASKSCFIACPTDDELNPLLELMSEKLAKMGIEPIIAVKERAYGQDIFCTKICGKIIESKFCIVILNDTVNNDKNVPNIPNPNVYYEYGLMTSLKKHIIPLQRDDLELAFNIQSYDTIKYNNKNIASELDIAIKDAVKITESKESGEKIESISETTVLRNFELAGLTLRDDDGWFLSNTIDDTDFRGFSDYERIFILLLGKLDEKTELDTYLEDLNVVLFRIEKKSVEIQENLEKLHKKLNEDLPFHSLTEENRINRMIDNEEKKLKILSNVVIAFIINNQMDIGDFPGKAEAITNKYNGRFTLVFSENDEIMIEDERIPLRKKFL